MRMMQQKQARESRQNFIKQGSGEGQDGMNLYGANPFGGLNTVTPGGSGESAYNMGLHTEYNQVNGSGKGFSAA